MVDSLYTSGVAVAWSTNSASDDAATMSKKDPPGVNEPVATETSGLPADATVVAVVNESTSCGALDPGRTTTSVPAANTISRPASPFTSAKTNQDGTGDPAGHAGSATSGSP